MMGHTLDLIKRGRQMLVQPIGKLTTRWGKLKSER